METPVFHFVHAQNVKQCFAVSMSAGRECVTFSFIFLAEIMVTPQLSIVKFRRNDQSDFNIYDGCHGNGHHLDFSSINLLIF